MKEKTETETETEEERKEDIIYHSVIVLMDKVHGVMGAQSDDGGDMMWRGVCVLV